jgi:hypothetical protein
MARKGNNYFENLFKETGQFYNAWRKSFDASADYRPGADARAAKANKKEREAQGQFLGALLQGRQYNKKGKQK